MPSGRKNGVPGLEGSLVNSERAAPIDRWSVSSSVKFGSGFLALLLVDLPRWECGFKQSFGEDRNKGALQEHGRQLRKNECGAKLSAEFHDC